MYKVMIVDDETIILSGIKFLLDWEKKDCIIAATARNGQDALEQIRKVLPDIVLADINMPVMDGITLLEKVNEEFPHIVFIMLTNLEEFELARQALQYRAADYLLKSRLESQTLEKSLENAKKERDKRARLLAVNAADYFEKKKQEEAVNKTLQEIVFFYPGVKRERTERLLADAGMLNAYGFFYVPFEFAPGNGLEVNSKEELAELMKWLKELTLKTADNIFKDRYMLLDTGDCRAFTLFVYNMEGDWEKTADMLKRKLVSTVRTITQVSSAVFHTHVYNGFKELKTCAEEYQNLLEQHYLERSMDEVQKNKKQSYEPLGLGGVGSQLSYEIRQRNLKGILSILDSVESRIQETVHQKSQAIWLLNELNRSVSSIFMDLGILERTSFEKISKMAEIESISTRSQVIAWLEMLKTILTDVIGKSEDSGNQIAEKARKYVLNNIEAHVSLQEAADFVGVSVGYLSTIFKREYGQNFIEFANRTKIEHACSLLEEKDLLITEIAYRLGYENAYYFSKVFRKYMGVSPADYRKKYR